MVVAANDEQPCLRPNEETYRDMWGPQHRGVIEGGERMEKNENNLILINCFAVWFAQLL